MTAGKTHLYAEPMTIELTTEQEQMVNAVAQQSRQTPEQVVSEILTLWQTERAAWAAELAEAREDLAAGRTLTSDEVWQSLEKILKSA